MRVIGLEAPIAPEPDAPQENDVIMAIDGVTFPNNMGFVDAISKHPIVITILRGTKSPHLGQEPSLGSSISQSEHMLSNF